MPFIVLEGLDGAGKSTQINKLKSMLEERGIRCEYLHFPRYDAPFFGELIARFLRGEFGDAMNVDPYIVALLFAGDRSDAAPMIREWLTEGRFVISDRYVYSNIAFQCAKLPEEKRFELAEWIFRLEYEYYGIPRPDMSMFLDVPFEFTREKLTAERGGNDRDYLNGKQDIHESSLELQRTVRETFVSASGKDDTLKIVDCSDGKGHMASPETNFGRIFEQVRFLIPENKLRL